MRLTELTADLQTLRENLADELLAINRYEEQAFSLSDEEAKEAVQRIVEDKKDHVARLLRLLQRLDVKQREKIERGEPRGGPRYTERRHAAVAQLARASACHAEGRGFEPLQPLRRFLLQIALSGSPRAAAPQRHRLFRAGVRGRRKGASREAASVISRRAGRSASCRW